MAVVRVTYKNSKVDLRIDRALLCSKSEWLKRRVDEQEGDNPPGTTDIKIEIGRGSGRNILAAETLTWVGTYFACGAAIPQTAADVADLARDPGQPASKQSRLYIAVRLSQASSFLECEELNRAAVAAVGEILDGHYVTLAQSAPGLDQMTGPLLQAKALQHPAVIRELFDALKLLFRAAKPDGLSKAHDQAIRQRFLAFLAAWAPLLLSDDKFQQHVDKCQDHDLAPYWTPANNGGGGLGNGSGNGGAGAADQPLHHGVGGDEDSDVAVQQPVVGQPADYDQGPGPYGQPLDVEQPLLDDGRQPLWFGQQPPWDGQQPPWDGQQLPLDVQQPPFGDQQYPLDAQQLPLGDQQYPLDGQQYPVGFPPPGEFQQPDQWPQPDPPFDVYVGQDPHQQLPGPYVIPDPYPIEPLDAYRLPGEDRQLEIDHSPDEAENEDEDQPPVDPAPVEPQPVITPDEYIDPSLYL